jgi:cyanophycin synthetase
MTASLTSLLGRIARTGRAGRVFAATTDAWRGVRPRERRGFRDDERMGASWMPAARLAVYRRIWQDAADEVGADLEVLTGAFWSLRRGDARTLVSYHHVQLDGPSVIDLALDKSAVDELLRRRRLPTVERESFDAVDPEPGLRFLRATAAPCVVKPAAGTSGGDGVTCGITTVEEFHRARLHAWRWSSRLRIERQAPGSEYRLAFLDGELVGVVRRRPPTVVGDGRSTVAELIGRENRHRREADGRAGISTVTFDLDASFTLHRQGVSADSVPASGAKIVVKTAVNQSGAADGTTIDPGDVSQDLVAEARAAVRAVGLRLGGVDLAAPDLTRSLSATGGSIIEVNGTPAFHYHYLVDDAEAATRVAVPVLRTLLE